MYTLHILIREGGRSQRPSVYENSRWNLRSTVLEELYKQGNTTFQHWLRSNETCLETTLTGYCILNIPIEFIKPFVRHQARWVITRSNRWKSFFLQRPVAEYKHIDMLFLVD